MTIMAQAQLKATPEVQALLDSARQALQAGKVDPAAMLYDQALAKAQELKDRKGQVVALGERANLYADSGQLQKALALYNQSLVLAHDLGDQNREANALYNMGLVYSDLSQPQKALELHNQALPIYRGIGNKGGEANTLINLGLLYDSLGEPQKALEFYNQALPPLRAIGDKSGEAAALTNMGNVHRKTGQPQIALELYNQALPLHREAGNKLFEANTLTNLGLVYADLGLAQKALECQNQALQLYRAIDDKSGVANARNNIGLLYDSLGQPQKALEFYNQALPIYRSLGNKQFEANTLTNLGLVSVNLSQPQKALEFYNQALPLHRALGNKSGEARVRNNIGSVYDDLGEPQKALEYYHQALSLYRAISDRGGEAGTLSNIGSVYDTLGQPQKALAFYNQALPLHRETGNKQFEANTLTNMAITEKGLQHPADAEAHYAQAVALLETLRENLGGLSEAKSTFLGSKINTYYHYLKLLLERGKTAAAFELAQKTKARSLLDLMASGRVKLDGELTVEERAQEQALRQRADFLNAQMVREGVQNEVGAKKRFAALKEELTKTESQLQTLTDTLYARHPGLAQKRVAKTATLAELAKLLPADTALLDYIVLAKDKLALFVVTRSGVEALTLPLRYQSLVSKAAAFRAACADPRKDVKPAAAELYSWLVSPAAKHLAGVKRLVVCPDGALWDVPFQALRTGGQFLVQRYELAYAYSATGVQAALAAKSGRKKPTQTLLAFANPDFGSSKRFGDLDDLPGQRPIKSPDRPIDAPSRAFDSVSRAGKIVALPGTQREADALKALFPSATVLTGQAAQESKVKLLASPFRYLHFATHGFFNDASPLLSSLVLAAPISPGLVSPGSCLATPNNGGKPGSSLAPPPPNPPLLGVAVSAAGGNAEDGFLTAREIFDLNLSAEMVVLSACNTARGVERTGDGVIGLTWALFVAGCPTQVVSQWSVDDASTATLMTSFYGNLVRKKLGKGAALRQASLALMASPKQAHPYYWAPFVLIGDWR